METLDRIFELIKERGWSKSQFAQRINKNISITTDWKIGRSESYSKLLPQIAEVLDTTEAYLRGETDDPRPNDKKIDALYEHQISPTMARLLKEVENMSDEKAIAALKYIRFLKQEQNLE